MVVRIGVVITLVLLGLFSVVYWTYAAGAPIGAAESISYYFGALAALWKEISLGACRGSPLVGARLSQRGMATLRVGWKGSR